jgi:hypothetical protein
VEFGDSRDPATKKTCGDFFGKGVATGVTPPVALIGVALFVANAAPFFRAYELCDALKCPEIERRILTFPPTTFPSSKRNFS